MQREKEKNIGRREKIRSKKYKERDEIKEIVKNIRKTNISVNNFIINIIERLKVKRKVRARRKYIYSSMKRGKV